MSSVSDDYLCAEVSVFLDIVSLLGHRGYLISPTIKLAWTIIPDSEYSLHYWIERPQLHVESETGHMLAALMCSMCQNYCQ